MKNINKIFTVSFLFLAGLVVTSCVQDDDFNTPEVTYEEPNIDVNTTISSVKEMFGGFNSVKIEAGDDSDQALYLEAYVVSSDKSGNFYKTIVIQDSPESPAAGISISTEATDTYLTYDVGRKIYFRVDGLYVGQYAGLPTIGTDEGADVGRIGVDEFYERILRSNDKVEMIPTVISIADISTQYLNTLVQFEDVQFPEGLLGQSFGNVDDTFSVNRDIENCEGETTVMRISGFSDFKNMVLPEGSGSLTSVLSVFNTTYQLTLRDENDVNFDGERCEEDGDGDGPVDTTGTVSLPYSEDFQAETAGVGVPLNIDGWVNVNINGGERVFDIRDFDGNKYTQTSAFNADENPYEVWLVTPGVDLTTISSATLSFGTKDGYYNGEALKTYVSTDFTGDPEAATWEELTGVNYSTGNADGYADNFLPSGDIDLSAYAGQVVYIGFEYAGGSSSVTTTYQIDNLSITEN
ncbi:DUF5689 domain-containing protein [Mesonia sp. MT50]|uniref:DUF5689 domain-containing protein n=1 Tax=Mesonia profundi TaxID=3070998 RepID=A0ABU1A5M5_9FLAO|nr:DUF5689 domain-containing protein [Mesonia profundi]MDQ7918681.1 DUF5689 domain-containing protein [Mesonia profundi]